MTVKTFNIPQLRCLEPGGIAEDFFHGKYVTPSPMKLRLV
jgi:hypothetical protein